MSLICMISLFPANRVEGYKLPLPDSLIDVAAGDDRAQTQFSHDWISRVRILHRMPRFDLTLNSLEPSA